MIRSHLSSRATLALYVAAGITFILLLTVSTSSYYESPLHIPSPAAQSKEDAVKANSPAHSYTVDQFLDIWKPSVAPDDPVFKPYNGFEYHLHDKTGPHFKKPLGKDMCIISIDSRPWDKEGYAFSDKPMEFDGRQPTHGQSLGVLQHWLYGKSHRGPGDVLQHADPVCLLQPSFTTTPSTTSRRRTRKIAARLG
jgi:hypothetical protein